MGEKWARLAPWRRGAFVDVLLALAVLAFTIPFTLTGRSFSLVSAPQWLQLAAGAATAAAMLGRRRSAWPMVAGAVVCAVLTGQLVPLTLAAYSMTAESRVRHWPWVVGAMTLAYMAVDYAEPSTDQFVHLVAVRGLTLVFLPALVGTWVRDYQRMIGELREGVRVREERAAAQERRRIAAELHDTVTHAVTVMVLNAGLIQDTEDIGDIRKLARSIEDKGVRALTELRELLTALRRRDLPPSAEGVEGIPQLVEESRATGLRVALHLDVPVEEMSREAGHVCYRVVQEGLNNVRKHAPGADVQVACEAHGNAVSLSVVNSGGSRPARRGFEAPCDSGYGLAGLRERLTLIGGRLCYGPTPEGGFSLTARVPFHPPDIES
ncbi:sensor histidine kinase [Microbispora sp. ATCC PTA-5024]|uniref:sensor histidine kinase n=1 Tax=Microbispora sp. ATCC PTA-5024 TaxID=316330 RepID=UPI0003DDDC5A|nr:histidine kinase [Microbispora sp. ATCC PTA-5024]ETK32717.1 histidine kinase [Microbispora sp. ATCC PTA-5024]